MMLSIVRAVLACALLVPFVPPAPGQSRPLLESPLTLDESVRLALERNPSLAAAAARVEAAVAEVRTARAAFAPDVSATAGYRRFESRIFLPETLPVAGAETIGPTDDWNASILAHYTLLDGGRRKGAVEAAEAAAGAREELASAERQRIVFEVHRAFHRVRTAEAAVTSARVRERRAEEHLRVAKRLKEAGAVPRIDVLRASAEVANARLGVVAAESERSVAHASFATLLDLPAMMNITVAGEEAGDQASRVNAVVAEGLEALTVRAVADRPEVKAARRQVELQQGRIVTARSGSRPNADLRASYGLRDDAFAPDDHEWSVGVSVRLSLFDGGATESRVARARAERLAEEADLDRLEALVREDVWTAWARLVEARTSIEAAAAAEREAAESVSHASRRYEAGAGTAADLLDAESVLAAAERRVIETRHALAVAESNLARAAGAL